MLDAVQGRDTLVRDTIFKGGFVQGAQHPRIFGRGHIGRGHINPAWLAVGYRVMAGQYGVSQGDTGWISGYNVLKANMVYCSSTPGDTLIRVLIRPVWSTGFRDELSLNEVSLNVLTSITNPLDFETLGQIIPDRCVGTHCPRDKKCMGQECRHNVQGHTDQGHIEKSQASMVFCRGIHMAARGEVNRIQSRYL